MGGFGSTRWRGHVTRRTTDELPALDIRWAAREGLLDGGLHTVRWTSRRGSEAVLLCADGDELTLVSWVPTGGGAWQEVGERLPITRTGCNFGGARPWFGCPGCGRRVAVVYGGVTGYRCRYCLRLAYGSTRESRGERLLRRADRLREKLGGCAGLGSLPGRPKGMHRRTYFRALDAIWDLEDAALRGVGLS